MGTRNSGLRVLDLYCGAGGFSEGFRQAGFDVVAGLDNWKPARDTHEFNGLGDAIDFDMLMAIDEDGYDRAKTLVGTIERKHGRIDVLIGSPPCTEFSYAKKGGGGDIEKGMLLVRAYLVFVAALKPTFWLMENVPRLKNALTAESEKMSQNGWYVPLEKLRVKNDLSHVPWVEGDYLHIPQGDIFVAKDYGAPQNRRRFIAGNIRPSDINKHRTEHEKTLGECVEKLQRAVSSRSGTIVDPNYDHHSIRRENLRDYSYDTSVHPMYWENMRHLKRRHIQYGKMQLPDRLDLPARTIMATLNPSSREAVTLETGKTMLYQGKERPLLRQPTVREVACLQGFPLGFQLVGGTLSTRYKLVGNAVPCQLAYSLALGVLDTFEQRGFGSPGQEARFEETYRRREQDGLLPIIHSPSDVVTEAKDFGDCRFMEFKAKKDRHIRRRLLSAKPENTSAMVIFENTEWSDSGKRRGGFWKSCTQLGVGKVFSQVYLDHISVSQILRAIDSSPHITGHLANGQETLVKADHTGDVRATVTELLLDIAKGVPVVHAEWEEFPGYDNPDFERYLGLISDERLKLPSATMLQRFFTSDVPETGGYIGALDLFDGIDALMLKCLSQPDRRWILKTHVAMRNLTDAGCALHRDRIHKAAKESIDGNLPLVTLLGALASVEGLYLMHSQDDVGNHPMFKSLAASRGIIRSWCGLDND